MKRKLIAVMAGLLIVVAMIVPTAAQYDSKPRCWTADDICQVRADTVWDNCRAEGGWYLICYMEYSATYDGCMSEYQCEGSNPQPKNQ